MKNATLILLLFFSLAGFAQTAEIELESVKARFENHEFSADQYKVMAKEWKKLIAELGSYPDLPLNPETNKVEYIFIDTLKGFDKKEIFQRVKEYAAIHFGNISAIVHYEDFETGKIIIKGNFQDFYTKEVSWWIDPSKELLTRIKCDFSADITVKDEKFMMKISNPMITHYYHYNFIEYSSQMPLALLYPITDSETKEWEFRIKELLAVKNGILNYRKTQLDYILNFKSENNF